MLYTIAYAWSYSPTPGALNAAPECVQSLTAELNNTGRNFLNRPRTDSCGEKLDPRLCSAVFAKAASTLSGTVFFPVNLSFPEKGPWATTVTEVLKSWLLSPGFPPVEVKTPALRPQLHLGKTIPLLSHLLLSPGDDSHHSGDWSPLPSLRGPLRRNMWQTWLVRSHLPGSAV